MTGQELVTVWRNAISVNEFNLAFLVKGHSVWWQHFFSEEQKMSIICSSFISYRLLEMVI